VATTELPAFYQALAHKLTLQLDRTRTECIRISRLKALSDTDSLMLLYDEREQLRLASIRIFGLPVSEKMVLLCKCFLTNDEMKTGGQQRMRMIIVTNYVVMDTAVFGPSISKTGSTMLRIDQLYEAYDNVPLESNSHSFCLKAVLENGEIAEWKIAFSTAATCHRVRASLSDMCTRGVQVRESLCQRPFDDPGIKRIIEKCGRYIHTNIRTNVQTHVYTPVYTHAYTHVRICTHIYTRTHICPYIRTYIHTYIHTVLITSSKVKNPWKHEPQTAS